MKRLTFCVGLMIVALTAVGARCIENSNQYTGRDGYIHVSGEMVNETDISAETVTLQATLFDSQGEIVAQATGRLCPENVQPRSHNLFDIRFESRGLLNAVRHEVRPIAGVTTDRQLPASGIQHIGFDARKFFNVAVRGDVRNNSARTYDQMSVCVAFYNASGRVIHVLSAPVEGSVAPGGDFHWGFADSGYSGNDAVFAAAWFIASPDTAWIATPRTQLTTLP
jgi:hypothetical protein